MMDNKISDEIKRWPFYKKLLFTFLPLIILLVSLEILSRLIYYHYAANDNIALLRAYNHIEHKISLYLAQRTVSKLNIPTGTMMALYSDSGEKLLEEFQQIYEKYFQELVNVTINNYSKLVVLYIPLYIPSIEPKVMEMNIIFFSNLCSKYNVDFINLKNIFMKYPTDTITLMPEDPHLSRFGNKLIVDEIVNFLKRYDSYFSIKRFTYRPKLFGDLNPNSNKIITIIPNMPYNVISNNQGLRMNYDLKFPKEKQRILILGDSLTYGPYLNNYDTYPELLNKKLQNKEFINAGVAGYTITDEVSLFMERARYVEPDVTILQICDNDLYDLFYFKRNQFARNKKYYEPSLLQKKVLDELRGQEAKR